MHDRNNVHVLVPALSSLLAAACGNMTQTPGTTPAAEPALHTFTSDSAGFDTQSHYLDTGAEVVVFDAQFTPALAEQLVDHIRARTTSPIRYLVITHPNPDKFNGAPVFRALGAQVVASRATADAIPDVHAYKRNFFIHIAGMFTEESYPAQPVIDITFDDTMELELAGNARVELSVLENAGVSSTQTVAAIPELDALVVGDLIHYRTHAWLEGGVVAGAPRPDLARWRAALDELSAFGDVTVHGGRGQAAPLATAAAAQRDYLTRVEELVDAYIAALGDRQGELLGDGAAAHHEALARLIAEAYPDYALPYMTQYSIYGLATTMAR